MSSEHFQIVVKISRHDRCIISWDRSYSLMCTVDILYDPLNGAICYEYVLTSDKNVIDYYLQPEYVLCFLVSVIYTRWRQIVQTPILGVSSQLQTMCTINEICWLWNRFRHCRTRDTLSSNMKIGFQRKIEESHREDINMINC